MSKSTVSYDMPVDDLPRDVREDYEMSPQRRRPAEDAPRRQRPRTKRSKPRKRRGLIGFFRDARTRFVAGVVFCILAMVTLIACVSYLKTGAADQSLAASRTLTQMAHAPEGVQNSVGAFGAKLAHWLMVDSLGLASLVVVFYLGVIGLSLLGAMKCRFWSLTFKCLVTAISLSIILGVFTSGMASTVNWGGNHGYYINEWLTLYSGWIGAYAVAICLIALLIGVYFTPVKKAIDSVRTRYREVMDARKARRQQAAGQPSTPIEDIPLVDVEPEKLQEQEHVPVVVNFEPEPQPESQQPAETKPATTDDIAMTIVDKTAEAPEEVNPDPTLQPDYDHRAELSKFRFPDLDLLIERPEGVILDEKEQQENKDMIVNTLRNYKIDIARISATIGPTVTLYEIVPAEGVRIAQIKRLEDDIALSLSALGIRIIAPIPGKGTIGIEVPNRNPQVVSIRRVLGSRKFAECKMALPMAMGATISNEIFIADLAKMPHLLVAGATGMGKSVGLNTIIASLLYKKHPTELKFVLVDPKMVEFSLYNKIEKHYLASLPDGPAIITDPKRAVETLNALCTEMDMRYDLLSKAGVRAIDEYNAKFSKHRLSPEKGHRYLPYIVMIVDEFADLTMTAGKDVLMPIARIAQKARAVGMHMILATQRPSTDVITGMIKANFPARIAFRVSQRIDSMTIIDRPGAHQLIGRGDMLFSVNSVIERVQCAFIDTPEVENIVEFIDNQVGFEEAYPLPEPVQESASLGGATFGDRDDKFDECARFVVTQTTASTSSLQRRFSIGYNKAGKIMDQLEAAGIVGPADGAKPRQVLVDSIQLERILSNS